MKLSRGEFIDIWKTLCYTYFNSRASAYIYARSYRELHQMVYQEFRIYLDDITEYGPPEDVVYQLLEWAERNNRIGELVQGVYKRHPDNLALRRLMAQLLGRGWWGRSTYFETSSYSRLTYLALYATLITSVMAFAFIVVDGLHGLSREATINKRDVMESIEPNSYAVLALRAALETDPISEGHQAAVVVRPPLIGGGTASSTIRPLAPLPEISVHGEPEISVHGEPEIFVHLEPEISVYPINAPLEDDDATDDLDEPARLAVATANNINNALFESMQRGALAFVAPPSMTTGDKYSVSARVIRNFGAHIEQKIAQGLSSANGLPSVEGIKVSPEMKAELVPESKDDFEITALSDEEQLVGKSDYTEWQWRVVPKTWGKKKLLLTVSAVLEAEGVTAKNWSLPVFEREIDVQVDPIYVAGSFVGAYWQWLATVVAIPMTVWLWRNIRNRETRRKESNPPVSPQLASLQAALLSAFTSKAKLQQMVRIQMGENLDAIASGDLSDITFDLITWADEQGRLDDLIMGAYRANSGNAKLKAFVEDYFGRLPEIGNQKP